MKLYLFSTPSCKPCANLKSYLDSNNIEYTVKDAIQDMELSMQFKIRSTPTLILLNNQDEVISSAVGFTTPEQKDKVNVIISLFNKS